MKEEWKDIKGYEGLYQISNLGRIKSLNYNRTKKEKILSNSTNRKGYLFVILYKNGKKKSFKVHRLVAIHFIENPNNYFQVNHKDENKSNNRVDNLEWCTQEYNLNYGTRNKRISEKMKGYKHIKETKKKISEKMKGKHEGSKHPSSRKVQCITTGKKFNCIKDAGEYYGLSQSITDAGITKCCQGKLKSAGKHPITEEKLKWKYID